MIQIKSQPELHLVFEGLGYIVGFAAYKRMRLRAGDVVEDQQRWSVIAAASVGGLVGSRILGLLNDAPGAPISLSQLMTPNGGKTIVGGLLGGWLGVEIAKKLQGIKARTGDLFAIPLCIGVAIGRIGCLLAGLGDDTYGTPTRLPWGVDFGDGIARHPTQAYEILFLSLLAFGLRLVEGRAHQNGAMFRYFLLAYLGWRLLIDFLKPQPLVVGMNVIQWACLAGLAFLAADRQLWMRNSAQNVEEYARPEF